MPPGYPAPGSRAIRDPVRAATRSIRIIKAGKPRHRGSRTRRVGDFFRLGQLGPERHRFLRLLEGVVHCHKVRARHAEPGGWRTRLRLEDAVARSELWFRVYVSALQQQRVPEANVR